MRFPRDPKDPWFSELQPEPAGFARPEYHVTRAANGPAAAVRPGDSIWLVAQLYTPWGKLPAALDARIDVSTVGPRHRGSGFRYAAAEGSRWFPLADVAGVLVRLESLRLDGTTQPVVKDLSRPIGRYLQRMRCLTSAAPLRVWEEQLSSSGVHFISYRIADGTRAAFQLAHELSGAGVPFFWDRWSLPRRLAERREVVGESALDGRIEDYIRRAEVVWGVETPLYRQSGSYAERERQLASNLGTYRRWS